jgi:hypothetical protein
MASDIEYARQLVSVLPTWFDTPGERGEHSTPEVKHGTPEINATSQYNDEEPNGAQLRSLFCQTDEHGRDMSAQALDHESDDPTVNIPEEMFCPEPPCPGKDPIAEITIGFTREDDPVNYDALIAVLRKHEACFSEDLTKPCLFTPMKIELTEGAELPPPVNCRWMHGERRAAVLNEVEKLAKLPAIAVVSAANSVNAPV